MAGWFYRLYLVMDIYSRKIVGSEVHERESADLAAQLIQQAMVGTDSGGSWAVLRIFQNRCPRCQNCLRKFPWRLANILVIHWVKRHSGSFLAGPGIPTPGMTMMNAIIDILRLNAAGCSQRQIARACKLSKGTEGKYLQRAAEAQITRPLPEGLSPAAVEQRLCPRSSALPLTRPVPPD